jgi:uncharacterized SAM-binding protein YcdF (DUF218 family)
MGLTIFLCYVLKKKKLFRWSLFVGIIFFLVCSTNYIPNNLIRGFEKQYPVLIPLSLDPNKHYNIHVLGSGYKLDNNLPAIAQLKTSALVRLSEGIRIYNLLPRKTLVTSGYSALNLESQASVSRRAAIELGVSPQKIKMLESPTTTQEEMLAFKDNFGKNANVILVTDAQHMPRAMRIYQAEGFDPIPAPTNFKVKFGPNSYNGFSLPNFSSMQLMQEWFREFLATLKFHFTKDI